MKPRVLFVDDDPMILNGMRRSLRGLRNQWDMSFANSGREALELFQSKPFDVIVSDMQMPEMTGNILLNEVASKHPECARLILSGYAEEKAILDTVVQAHQFLAKPCDFEVIKSSLDKIRSVLMQQLDEALKSRVIGLNQVLSSRDAVEALSKELAKENPSMSKLVEVIGNDLAMTVQVFRLSASAFFRSASSGFDLEKMVIQLGPDLFRKLQGDAQIFKSVEEHDENVVAVNGDARTCLAKIHSAIKAEEISEEGGQLAKMGAVLFFAAVLISYHDATLQDISLESHRGLAAVLAGIWGLDSNVISILSSDSPADNEVTLGAKALLAQVIADVGGYVLFEGAK